MGAKRPKKSAAQIALEEAQLRQLRENERAANIEALREYRLTTAFERGELGAFGQLSALGGFAGTPMQRGNAVNPAQAHGAILPTDLTRSSTDVMEAPAMPAALDPEDLKRMMAPFAGRGKLL